MFKISFRISVIIASLAIVFSSCSKDDNDSSSGTTAVFNSSVSYGSMTDQDGNVYKTVTIGKQTWMAENLRTTTYNDGTAIPNVTDNDSWSSTWSSSTGAYCTYHNTTDIDTIATFGRLYNWYAVNTGKLAPKGWHVPTDAEWTTLAPNASVSGGKLKETGTKHWDTPNSGATNKTGFTALPGGDRDFDGAFLGIGGAGVWWSATEDSRENARCLDMVYYAGGINRTYLDKRVGMSIRCVKD